MNSHFIFHKRNIFSVLLVLAFCFALISCLGGKDVAGGSGSQTTNTIAGVLKDQGGNPEVDIPVLLLRRNYDPGTVSSAPPETLWTNGKGEFEFQNVGPGLYNILARNSAANTAVLIQDLFLEEEILKTNFLEMALLKTGVLQIQRSSLKGMEEGLISIPGTDILKKVTKTDLQDGFIEMSGIPAAGYTEILYREGSGDSSINIQPEKFEIGSGDTVRIEPFSRWEVMKKIVLNTTASGIDVQSNVYDFPLLIKLGPCENGATRADCELMGAGRPNGNNLRIVKSDGVTELPFHKELWDQDAGRAVIWIKLDTLFGNSASQTIFVYSGNPEAAKISAPQFVFDSAGGYFGVWHMGQPYSSPASQVKDASENFNNANWGGPFITEPIKVGLIYRAVSLSDSQYIVSTVPSTNPDVFTMSVWFKTADTTGGRLFGFGNTEELKADRHLWFDNQGRVNFGVYAVAPDSVSPEDSVLLGPNNGIRRIITSSEAYNDNEWHLVTASLSPRGMRLYMDGRLVAENPEITAGQKYTGYWRLGMSRGIGGWARNQEVGSYSGLVDEARVIYRDLSDDWIKASFESQKADGRLVQMVD